MDNSIEPLRQRRVTNIYTGPTEPRSFNRSIAASEERWKKEDMRIPSFDGLIVARLEQAKTEGRETLQVVDIGSGEAGIFHDFFDNPNACVETKAFLRENPTMKIHMFGLTDARDEQEFNTSIPIEARDPGNPLCSQVKAENSFYTLTSSQTLANFLRLNNISNVDIFLATVSLTYMGPATFKQVLSDAIEHLRPGGRLIASSYADLPPGYHLDDSTFIELNVPDAYKADSSLGKTIVEAGAGIFNSSRDPKIEEENIYRAIELFKKLGVLTEEEIVETRDQIDTQTDLSKPEQLARLARDTLIVGKQRLKERKLTQIRKLKEDIIDGLKSSYASTASIATGKQTIYLEKT